MEELKKHIASLKYEAPIRREKININQQNFNNALFKKMTEMVKTRSSGSKSIEIIEEMKPTYSQIYRYLNNDYSLEEEKKHISLQPWNLNKGLFLIGDFGRGKTLLLDLIFESRQQLGILGRYTTAFELSKYYTQDQKTFENLTNGECSFFLDEIGDEPKETLHFGNAENVAYRAMKLFFDKVEKQSNKHRFFGTSNLGQGELIDRYKERIWSRIVGNCNIIIFGDGIKDFRK